MRPFFPLLVLVLLLSGCDAAEPPCSAPGDPACTPSPDEIVAGVNLDALLAPPTAAELTAVRADWAERDRRVQGPGSAYVVETVATHTTAGGGTMRALAGLDRTTRDTLFAAALYLPPRLQGNALPRPLVLVLPEDDEPLDAEQILPSQLPLDRTADDVAYALLAYRGLPLRVAGRTLRPAAAPDPYGLDVDDALALVHAVRGDISAGLFPDRLVAMGLGRGGATALLAAERDAPFQLVVAIQPPTTFLGEAMRDDLRTALLGGAPSSLPGFPAVAAASAVAVRDGAASLAEARLTLLSRSPSFFAQPPPFHVLAYGTLHPRVPVLHGRTLAARLARNGSVVLETEDAAIDWLVQNGDLIELIDARVRSLLIP